jgi:hypothetical protein
MNTKIGRFLGESVPSVSTQESWAIRRKAIETALEHAEHTVLGHRVDVWRDKETGAYIALIDESITQGGTEKSAVLAAESLIKIKAKIALGIPPEAK